MVVLLLVVAAGSSFEQLQQPQQHYPSSLPPSSLSLCLYPFPSFSFRLRLCFRPRPVVSVVSLPAVSVRFLVSPSSFPFLSWSVKRKV